MTAKPFSPVIRNGFWRTVFYQCFLLCLSLAIVTRIARKFCKYFLLFYFNLTTEMGSGSSSPTHSKLSFRIFGIVLWSIKVLHSLHHNCTFYKMCHLIIFTAASGSLIVVHFSTGLNIVCQIVSWMCLSEYSNIAFVCTLKIVESNFCHSRIIYVTVAALHWTSTDSNNRWTQYSLSIAVVVVRADIPTNFVT